MILKHKNHKFVNKTVWIFEDKEYEDFFFIQELVGGGSLLKELEKETAFNEEKVRFYTA